MAAKESGLSEEYIKKTEQMKSTSFLYGLYMSAQQLPMNDQIFAQEQDHPPGGPGGALRDRRLRGTGNCGSGRIC